MASTLQHRGAAIFRRRLVSEILRRDSVDSVAVSLLSRRKLHLFPDGKVNTYDKNAEDIANPTAVPDHMIPSKQDQYWVPDPQTGVFGPSSTHSRASANAHPGVDKGSVLEQKTFIRPMEDLDKPESEPLKGK